MYTDVTPIHEGWRYKTESSSDPALSGVQANVRTCMLVVPFPHVLQRAFASYRSRTKAGANGADTIKLFRSDGVGGAQAQIGPTLTLADANEANPMTLEFTPFTSTEEAEQVGPTTYILEINLDNAGDVLNNPTITIMYTPIPPGPA